MYERHPNSFQACAYRCRIETIGLLYFPNAQLELELLKTQYTILLVCTSLMAEREYESFYQTGLISYYRKAMTPNNFPSKLGDFEMSAS